MSVPHSAPTATPRRGLLAAAAAGGAALVTLSSTQRAHAEPAAGTPPFDGVIVNVTDVGAKGDDTTDDTDAIRHALDLAGSGGGVLFPAGTYLVSDRLRPKADQVLLGQGAATIRSTDGSFVMIDCRASVQLHGLTFDGNKANTPQPPNANYVDALRISLSDDPADVVVRGCTVTGAWGRGIVVTGSKPGRIAIADSTVDNCGNYGVYLTTGSAVITQCTISGNRNGLMGNEVDDVTVASCLIEDNVRHGIVFVYSSRWHVRDCRCCNNGLAKGNGWGITAGGIYKDPFPPPNHDFTITDNVCTGNGAGGITLDPTVRQEGDVIQVQNATVSGNVCSQAARFHGINLSHARDVVISNNVCRNNPYSGIQVSSSSHVLIQGNICTQNDYGIGLSSTTTAKDPGHHVLGINMLYDNNVKDIRHEFFRGEYPLTGVRQYGLHGSVKPEGQILANPGTEYEWHDGEDGAVYVKTAGEASTDGWRRVSTTGRP